MLWSVSNSIKSVSQPENFSTPMLSKPKLFESQILGGISRLLVRAVGPYISNQYLGLPQNWVHAVMKESRERERGVWSAWGDRRKHKNNVFMITLWGFLKNPLTCYDIFNQRLYWIPLLGFWLLLNLIWNQAKSILISHMFEIFF